MNQLRWLLASSLLLLAACGGTPAPQPKEQPITAHFTDSNYTITATGSGNYEYGLKFSVAKSGKILRLGIRFPQVGSYRVTIWDFDSKTVLAQATIAQPGILNAVWQNITPLSIQAGKKYFVSVFSSTQWFRAVPKAGGALPYPITVGNVSIEAFQWISASLDPTRFPTNVDNTYYAGIADFEFQAD